MAELIQLWHHVLVQRTVHPLIALGAFNLDFLCVHPFRDGNGRVSRLLLLLLAYQRGLEVGRYISLERLIEQNKERYYETLKLSSDDWHKGTHNPWTYITSCCTPCWMLTGSSSDVLARPQRPEARSPSWCGQPLLRAPPRLAWRTSNGLVRVSAWT